MAKNVLYFGYWANSRLEMMAAITGNDNLKGIPATLPSYELCVQRLDQIPDTIFPGAPIEISPRRIIASEWLETFRSYTIRQSTSGDKAVAGMIWELTPLERDLVCDWELIDFGWYQDIEAVAVTEYGEDILVVTEGLRPGQEIDKVVDGLTYPPFLNSLEDFARIAEKARREFFERMELEQ